MSTVADSAGIALDARHSRFFPACQTGLVGERRELVGLVAAAQLDVAKQLAIGGVHESGGHLTQGCFGGGPQLLHQGLDAPFAVFGGR